MREKDKNESIYNEMKLHKLTSHGILGVLSGESARQDRSSTIGGDS